MKAYFKCKGCGKSQLWDDGGLGEKLEESGLEYGDMYCKECGDKKIAEDNKL